MYYEIDNNGNKIRPLRGYFNGFKDDLKDINLELLSDIQKDYMSIPIERIVKISEEEHVTWQNIKIVKDKRIEEIKAECDLLDAKSIRPMRDGETELVAEIKAQIAVLREEYNRLVQ